MARLFVDNLTVMDFSFLDFDRGVVGESWIVDIELAGELDDQGMVFDFGHIKKQIKQFIDAQADHRLLVPVASPNCVISEQGDELSIEFQLSSGGLIQHQSPAEAVLLIDSDTVEADLVAKNLESELKELLAGNIKDISVKLRTEHIDGAYYHYTHGLQKHQGQCQRIAHGHRSKIEVEINGQRNAQLEALWASRLADIYVATESHLKEKFEINGIPHIRLGYTAMQGEFSISMPDSQIFIIPYVSTVENIAGYLAEMTASDVPGKVVVKAFEGVEKGAIGTACK